jgi:hypothetical protein
MFTASVHEIHANTGKTLPLRAADAKSGNRFWGTLMTKNDGSKVFSKYGVNVDESTYLGEIAKVRTLKVAAVDGGVLTKDLKVEVEHDTNDKGKARITASETFTGSDGERWKFDFRATLTAPGVVNVKASLNRAGGFAGGPRVQAEL